MAFEVGTKAVGEAEQLPSPSPFGLDFSEAASLGTADIPSSRTVQDACEIIRAHFRATAELIQAVYLQEPKSPGNLS